MGQGIMALN